MKNIFYVQLILAIIFLSSVTAYSGKSYHDLTGLDHIRPDDSDAWIEHQKSRLFTIGGKKDFMLNHINNIREQKPWRKSDNSCMGNIPVVRFFNHAQIQQCLLMSGNHVITHDNWPSEANTIAKIDVLDVSYIKDGYFHFMPPQTRIKFDGKNFKVTQPFPLPMGTLITNVRKKAEAVTATRLLSLWILRGIKYR